MKRENSLLRGNKGLVVFVFFVVLILPITVGCSNSKQATYDLQDFSFLPLETMVLLFNEEVHSVDEDAEIQSLIYDLSNPSVENRVASAFYRNQTDYQIYYFLQYFSDGSITIKEDEYNSPATTPRIIASTTNLIDPNEAWNLFSQANLEPTYISDGIICGMLMLMDIEIDGELRLVWRLVTRDCAGGGSLRYHLDAKTGEFLGKW